MHGFSNRYVTKVDFIHGNDIFNIITAGADFIYLDDVFRSKILSVYFSLICCNESRVNVM